MRRLYQDLLRARREWPALSERTVRQVSVVRDGDAPCLCFQLGATETLQVRANLSGSPLRLSAAPAIEAGSKVLFSSAAEIYGGERSTAALTAATTEQLEPYECVVWGAGRASASH